MKKTILLAMFFVCCAQIVSAQGSSTSLEDIDAGWATKPISNVANGSFDTMLERFDQTWSTWMVRAVRNTM